MNRTLESEHHGVSVGIVTTTSWISRVAINSTTSTDGGLAGDVYYDYYDYQDPTEHTWLRWIVYNMDIYLVPFVILAGLIGNSLSFVVFAFTRLRRLSSSVYLAALAISDNGFLVCVFVGWLVNVDFNFYEYQGLCQLFIYLTYIFGFLSVAFVVGFTVERYIAVCFPFKRGDMCTPQRAKAVVIVMALVAILAFNPILWISTVDVYDDTAICHIKPGFHKVGEAINHMDTVVTLVVPSLAILVINVRIVFVVLRVMRKRKAEMPSSRSSSLLLSAESQRSASQRKLSTQVTRLLLVVSTIFLILNIPNHVIRLHLYIMQFVNPSFEPSTNYKQCKILFQHIYYINFSINFLLYSVCGRNFRQSLKFLCQCKREGRNNQQQRRNARNHPLLERK